MVRVFLKVDKVLFLQVIDDPLHVLTTRTKVSSKPSDRKGMLGIRHGPKNLPAGAA